MSTVGWIAGCAHAQADPAKTSRSQRESFLESPVKRDLRCARFRHKTQQIQLGYSDSYASVRKMVPIAALYPEDEQILPTFSGFLNHHEYAKHCHPFA
jgi:hypothetical protein